MNCSSFRRPAGRLSAVIVLLLLVGVCASATTAWAARKPKPEFQIKFATLAPEGSSWMKTMHAIDDQLRLRTDNRVGFKFYPGGVQGDEKEVLRKIRNGQLHGGGFTGFGLGAIVSDTRVLEMPFMFDSLEELDHVRGRIEGQLNGLFDAKGYLNLGWVDVGFIYIFSKNAITNPDDLQQAKMWVWAGDPLAELFFKAFSLSPIPLAAPDVLTSLQTGVIDAAYASTLACVALQWFTRIDYMTDIPITHGLGAALVSNKALSKVDPADVAILTELARPLLRDLTETTRVQNVEAIGEMEKEGVQVVAVSSEIRAQFFETGRSAWDDGVGELYSQELLDEVKTILQEYRSGAAAVDQR